MTTEEKAKAYDEALNWMRKLYPGLHGATKEDAEHYFPELRESEDEKIRKWLYDYISNCPNNNFAFYGGVGKDAVLNYLEKQKEQKPYIDFIIKPHKGDNNNPYDMRVSEAQEYAIKRGFGVPFNDGEVYVDERHLTQTIGNILRWADEHPKEQKPAEWSEDYQEENIQTRFAFYTYKDDPSTLYLSNVFVEEASRNHGFGTRILRAAEKVAETIGATTISLKVKQDSPANAWYRKNGYGYVAFEDGYDWLEKNLEYLKPVKQEWSEEDEVMLKCVIVSVRTLRDADGGADVGSEYDLKLNWLENRLKFLRSQPYWKPSEEQMDALKDLTYGTYQNGDGPALRELYEQLKKLM